MLSRDCTPGGCASKEKYLCLAIMEKNGTLPRYSKNVILLFIQAIQVSKDIKYQSVAILLNGRVGWWWTGAAILSGREFN